MSFRRKTNAHDWWQAIVRENAALLSELPPDALANEAAFREYVTYGAHRDMTFTPSVSELSPQAVNNLWTFIHRKACFDMDAILFEHFNQAFRRLHAQTR